MFCYQRIVWCSRKTTRLYKCVCVHVVCISLNVCTGHCERSWQQPPLSSCSKASSSSPCLWFVHIPSQLRGKECVCVNLRERETILRVCKNSGWGLERPCKGEDRKLEGKLVGLFPVEIITQYTQIQDYYQVHANSASNMNHLIKP